MTAFRTLAILLVVSPALAAADMALNLDGTTLRKLSRQAPFGTEFGNTRIKFRLPDGLRYVTEDKLPDFIDKLKLAAAGDEAGAVIPDDMGWYTMIFLIKEANDPLTGQTDLTSLNKETLTTWNEKFTEDHTPRRAGSDKLWRLGNWTHPPAWDADKKVLSMGTRMTTGSADNPVVLINYKLFVYGPEKQIVMLQCVAPTAEGRYEKAVERTKKLVDEITYPAPHAEANANEEMMYYAKLAGGGLIGAFVVIVGAKMAMGGKRRARPKSMQGLPR